MGNPKQLLFLVEDTFDIKGRGLLVVPRVLLGPKGQYTVQVELRQPNGKIRTTTGRGLIECSTPPSLERKPGHVLQFTDLRKEDVPVGTEVWALEVS